MSPTERPSGPTGNRAGAAPFVAPAMKHRPDAILSLAAMLAAAAGLTSQEAPPATLAGAWQHACHLGAHHKAPVLAFVLPPADAPADPDAVRRTRELERSLGLLVVRGGDGAPPMRTACDVLLRQVQTLRARRGAASQHARRGHGMPAQAAPAQLVFALTVPVLATAEACGARPGENVVLRAADGARIAGWKLDLLDPDAFVAALGKHLFSDRALAPRRANVAPPAQAALLEVEQARRKLEHVEGDPEPRQLSAWDLEHLHAPLAEHLVALAPTLVRRERAPGRTDEQLVGSPELAAIEQARPPLGTTAKQELGDPCPACGMGYTPPNLTTVLRLIGP